MCREATTCRTDAAYAAAQIAGARAASVPPMEPIPRDLKLAVHVSPGDTYEWSKVLLARANVNTLELLTAAWEKVLGYGRHELEGKTLRQLMGPSQTAATEAVVAILDQRNMDPVDLTVHSRAGEARRLRLHRRFDAYTHKMFIFAEEGPARTVRASTQTV
jgi:hypothetical protein